VIALPFASLSGSTTSMDGSAAAGDGVARVGVALASSLSWLGPHVRVHPAIATTLAAMAIETGERSIHGERDQSSESMTKHHAEHTVFLHPRDTRNFHSGHRPVAAA
jgi:hypothetical protein